MKFGNYKAIDINLDNIEILILATDEKLKPFYNWKRNEPDWWNAYNNVKHNGFINKKEGNLFNVIYSLSALFLINCINENTKNKLIEYGYYELSPEEYREFKRKGIWFYPLYSARSQLFEYEKKPSMGSIDEW